MGNEYFSFKHFRIRHDRCAMKVGTDGVLLGAWASVGAAGRILDIGCGSGLVALMAAQRSRGRVVGVEIDEASARQASENAAASPFADRMEIVHADIRRFCPREAFDCVLSNPPFFAEALLPPDEARAAARHTNGLPFGELLAAACRLMAPRATFQLILPATAQPDFLGLATAAGLWLLRATSVVTVTGKAPKRVLLSLTNERPAMPPAFDTLPLCGPDGRRSRAYSELTRDFYL